MSKWEYQVFDIWTDSYTLRETLHDLGKDGWEVISVVAFPDFKREVWAKRPLTSTDDLLLED